jgi:hypothetical protein
MRPHPGPQEYALSLPDEIYEILFGGSRGPGKTWAGMDWVGEEIDNPLYRALVIRKNAEDLSDWIDRMHQMYKGDGVKVAYKPAVLTFPSGAVIKTGHLKDDQAYTKYQGHEYQRMLIEELTQISSEKRYLQLTSACRSTVPGLPARIFATTNPGGVGHGWVKKRFIDTAVMKDYLYKDKNGKVKKALVGKPYADPTSGRLRVFVPAHVDDNPTLMENDPSYIHFLDSLKDTDEELWKAWRLGDWDVFAGQVFREFRRDIHVSDRLNYPLADCKKIISFDWGYNDPGAAHFIAIEPENPWGITHIYVYRELHQNHKTPEEWADQLAILTGLEDIEFMVLPHDCFATPHGKQSIATIFKQKMPKVRFIPGDTMQKGARLNRLALTHQYLSIAPDGEPYMRIRPTCKSLIETLPTLVYDDTNVEDLDSSGDDHDYDSVSLGLMTIRSQYNINSGPVRQIKPGNKSHPWNQQNNLVATVDFTAMMKNRKKNRSPEKTLK